MSAQISARAQRTIDRAALETAGWIVSPSPDLKKRGLVVPRDGVWVLSRRAWSLLSEWVVTALHE